MMKCLFCLLVVALAPLPEPKKPVDDRTNVQGTWAVVSFERENVKLAPEDIPVKSLSFEGDNLTIRKADEASTGTFKLDANQKLPHLDLAFDLNGMKLDVKLLYKLDGDTLTIYVPKNETDERPASYEAAAVIITMKREKK